MNITVLLESGLLVLPARQGQTRLDALGQHGARPNSTTPIMNT